MHPAGALVTSWNNSKVILFVMIITCFLVNFGTHLSNFWLIIGGFRTKQGHSCFFLSHFLTTHTASLCLPDLTSGHLYIAGTPSCAGKGWYWLGNTSWVLEHVYDGGEMTFISTCNTCQWGGQDQKCAKYKHVGSQCLQHWSHWTNIRSGRIDILSL